MDVKNHLMIFVEFFCLTLHSCAIYFVSKGLLCHYVWHLMVSAGLFGAAFYFRVKRPPEQQVTKILGSVWGAYGDGTGKGNEDEDAVKVIGHRACGLDAPENSISALKRMSAKGIRMVEFDVVLTADNIPIVFHDSNFSRMTNVNREVCKMSLNEIMKLDISVTHPFGENFPNERIQTLHKFVSSCIKHNIRMIIDLKAKDWKIVKIINDLYKDFPELYSLAIVSSFNPFIIYKIRANDPDIVSSLCWRPYYYSHEEYNGLSGPSVPRSKNLLVTLYHRFLNVLHSWLLWRIGYYVVGVSVLLLAKDAITREEVRQWNKKGIRLIAWTVNLPSEKQYFEKNLKIAYLTDTVINS